MKFFEKKTGENDSGTPEMQDMGPENGGGKFSPKRIVIGVIATVVLLWLLSTVIGFFMPSASKEAAENELITDNSGEDLSDQDLHSTAGGSDTSEISPHTTQSSTESDSLDLTMVGTKESITETLEPGQHAPGESTPPITLPVPKTSEDTPDKEAATPHEPVAHGTHDQRPGIATTKAIIEVLEYAVVTLAERMSRTGSTALYDPNLEMAMNWIMVKAESYWFPSAESKYKETIMDMQGYLERMEKGSAIFFTRTDNLIPLLASFEDLLGSCDEILLKSKEDDGTNVSFFKVDDYFYYTKGVIDSMLTILEAVREDYYKTLESRRSLEIIDHALHSLEHGEHINPWIVLDSDLDSIFANHRSNLAGPVSHARFHLGLLIKALST